MTKEIHKEKNRDLVLWEDFVLKNNIKKKSSDGSDIKSNFRRNKKPIIRTSNTSTTYAEKIDKPVLKNSKLKHFIGLSPTKVDIDVEKNKLRRIKTGKICIDGRIDLHGFSLVEAEKKLKQFVGDSLRLKKRFLLVITGKGRNSKPNIHGEIQTINSEIKRWISDNFYRDKVQYVAKALDKHGGTGAYYFFLKKS